MFNNIIYFETTGNENEIAIIMIATKNESRILDSRDLGTRGH